MTGDDVQAWLDRYVEAWRDYDPDKIAALFAEDAEYRYHPWDAPVVGRAAIVGDWLDAPDAAGTYEAHYEPFLVDDDGAVAIGWSTYLGADGAVARTYDNCFLLRFDGAGACRSFTEWFMERPADAG